MPRLRILLFAMLFAALPLRAIAQEARTVKPADERFKTDILVVVAHPDDEAAVTPYLARAIYDEHKRVAVVYGTRGGSGANEYRRESGPALAEVREQEARQACAALGITNVWFLDGKDTASQDVLNSLANWGHGKNLEEMVRLVRLTRPEVILTWLPGIFIGENHGDHQAAGVLATEAFDLAADSTAFPSQVAGASKRLEPYLENLAPWQPKKIYYFSDANDQKQFAGTGPAYSVKEVSPSQEKPYWRLALDAAKAHLTQFPGEIQGLSKMSDEQLQKMMDDPQSSWWSDPMTLIFGKSLVPAGAAGDVFAAIGAEGSANVERGIVGHAASAGASIPEVELAGPWLFYEEFRRKHGLAALPKPAVPEIGVKAGTLVSVPFLVRHVSAKEVEIRVSAPDGWKIASGAGKLQLPAEAFTMLRVDIETPVTTAEELKTSQPAEVTVAAYTNGNSIGEAKLRVKLQANALPQN